MCDSASPFCFSLCPCQCQLICSKLGNWLLSVFQCFFLFLVGRRHCWRLYLGYHTYQAGTTSLFQFLKYLLIFIGVCLFMCVCIVYVSCAHRGQKRAQYALKLESQVVLNCLVGQKKKKKLPSGFWELNPGPLQEHQMLFIAEPSLQLQFHSLLVF